MFEKDRHYIETLDADEIDNAVAKLRENPESIKQLKVNAKKYYNENLAPKAVVNRIINRLIEV